MTHPVIDAHMHQWSVTDHDDWYPDLKPFAEHVGSDTLYTDFLPADYRTAAPGLDVRGFVHVNATTAARTYLEEMGWVDEIADAHELNAVFIGSIDPELPQENLIADLEQQAAYRRFRGVRIFPGIDPAHPVVGPLLDWLERGGYIFDLVASPEHMAAWTQILAARPHLAVVLEHTGSPSATDTEGFASWQVGITELARETTTACKVCGLGMATMDLSEPTLRPWIETAIDTFGWDRVLFGSNMPIETMAGSYTQWLSTLDTVIGTATDEEQRRFYTTNAERIYKI